MKSFRIGVFFLFPFSLHGGDWPQILGPHRNGVADDETLTAGQPEVLWQVETGEGFAGPVVADGRVVLFHRAGDSDRVEAFEAATGKRLWQTDFPARYRGGINPDKGPRCVPLVHRGNIYLFGAGGDLHSLRLGDGKKRWSRHTAADFDAPEGYFGFGSTPMVLDEKLLVNVGGRSEAGLVAFDLESGKTLWKATNERASYSSPTVLRDGSKSYALFITRLNTVAVDPSTGVERFRFPFGQRGATVNAAMPLVIGDHLFVTASYGIGAKWIKIDGSRTETIWEDNRVMSSQYPTSVYQDGYLYGIHGREDVGVASYQCLEARTGKIQWNLDDFGMAHTILADGKLLILKLSGELLLVQPSPEKMIRLAASRVARQPTRALPALSRGKFYFRTNAEAGAGDLKCLQLK